jgi:3-carboxy-cis,cis-muconate cycloisomerase
MFVAPEVAPLVEPEAWLRRMLDFEAAHARARSRAGLLDPAIAQEIVEACARLVFDPTEVLAEATESVTPVVPLLGRLRSGLGAEAADQVHRGATSQDVVDTASMLLLREGASVVAADLRAAALRAAELAERHRHTPMMARTLLKQALPTTFGLKAAGWLAGLAEAAAALDRVGFVVQFGGPAGNLHGEGTDGLRVAELLADELGLGMPTLPWHSDRRPLWEVVAALAGGARASGKVGTDVKLLAQDEVAEVEVRAGGSSSMTHKRNPVDAVAAVAAARLALGAAGSLLQGFDHEHERAAGAWQAEWPMVAAVLGYTSGAARAVRTLLENLEPVPSRMADRVEQSPDLVACDLLIDRALDAYGRYLPS